MDNFLCYFDSCLDLSVLEAFVFHSGHHKGYILKGAQGITSQKLGKINLLGQCSILRSMRKCVDLMYWALYRRDQLLQRAYSLQNYLEKKIANISQNHNQSHLLF